MDSFLKPSKVNFEDFSASIFLAGQEQRHYIYNTFNVLANQGFLRDQQGIQTLEVVQRFYEITKLKPIKAKKVELDILDVCPTGHCVHSNQAVITCVKIDSSANVPYYHAVMVSELTIDCV